MNARSSLKTILHYTAVLLLVCLISGGGLGWFYSRFLSDIRAKQKKIFQKTLRKVLGDYADEQLETVGSYPEGTSRAEKVYAMPTDGGVRYAATGQAQGYQSVIKVMVSTQAPKIGEPLSVDPVIHKLAVVSSQETPGLGERINEVEKDVSLWAALRGETEPATKRPQFQKQFSGKGKADLEKSLGGGPKTITPLTGATITSEATVRAALDALNKIVERTRQTYSAEETHD